LKKKLSIVDLFLLLQGNARIFFNL